MASSMKYFMPIMIFIMGPGAFISFVVITYILWISPAHRGPAGVGLELDHAYLLAGFVVVVLTMMIHARIGELKGDAKR